MPLPNERPPFRRRPKVSETLGPELRPPLPGGAGLKGAPATDILAGRNVVIAGSAGGGKTHLLRQLSKLDRYYLPPLVSWPHEDEPRRGQFVRVVPDATALLRGHRKDLRSVFDNRPRSCLSVVVAIN